MSKKIIILAVAAVAFTITTSYSEEKIKSAGEKNVENHGVVVLELFTSQGCSSCPPADALLQRVKKQYPKEVFALSYHVDYWNYIGWEDPFSKSAYTKKQTAYNRKFRNRSNYTPQLVINGREHFVGSNAQKMNNKITQYKKLKTTDRVDLEAVEKVGGKVHFDFSVEGGVHAQQLRAVLVLNERTTQVNRGENRHRKLTNANIVVAEKYLPIDSSSGYIDIPATVFKNEPCTLMLLLENEAMDIVAAAKKPL
ncbi:thioredoxin family protein [Allomuricauda sp. SCSIO 65647]|uniref:DUF1223 domain-containing protein n=1 Tax=Allomuricauda sp. SCSIO 65647 TaxID=2908843 RepID=UPI001F39D9AC|nr:DUF1223 domain-containing protein [Muricauda sp. SCSIO 65647]UJH66983.1 DUF1223 domain-containing protein [Muricauda sp. SCSIO 65647]